jgi:hypothetical protein
MILALPCEGQQRSYEDHSRASFRWLMVCRTRNKKQSSNNGIDASYGMICNPAARDA